jgi:hypothetical protein
MDGDTIEWGDEMKFCIRESDISKDGVHIDMDCESSDLMVVATVCLALLKRNEGMFFYTLMEMIKENVNILANTDVSDEDMTKMTILSHLKDKGE